MVAWPQWLHRSSHELSYSTMSPVSTGIGDHLWVGVPPRYVTKPTRSTQPCIPPRSLNRVPDIIGCGKGGNVSSAGWQVTLCDPTWHANSYYSPVYSSIRFALMLCYSVYKVSITAYQVATSVLVSYAAEAANGKAGAAVHHASLRKVTPRQWNIVHNPTTTKH